MAGVLDSARYRTFLAWELGVSVQSVQAMVLGGHGDDMVPIRSHTTVNGIPVASLIKADRLDAIEKRVRGAGGEVVGAAQDRLRLLLAGVTRRIQMAEAYLYDRKQVLPVRGLPRGRVRAEAASTSACRCRSARAASRRSSRSRSRRTRRRRSTCRRRTCGAGRGDRTRSWRRHEHPRAPGRRSCCGATASRCRRARRASPSTKPSRRRERAAASRAS